MTNFSFLATTAAANGTTGFGGKYGFIILLVLMFVVMYFTSIRPQKKKQKEEQEMRDNLQIGDEITTIGGICGRVVTVKEDSLIIETGADRNKMKITRWAIQTNNTANEKLQAEREAAKEAAEKEKAAGGPARKRFGRKKEESESVQQQHEKELENNSKED